MLRILCFSTLLLVACGDDAATQPQIDPPTPGVGASSGSGIGSNGQPCDGSTFSCGSGFCNTQQQCGDGFCLAAPAACTGPCTGSCGCDGVYYCNACIAHQSGTDVALDADCPLPPPIDYTFSLATDLVRILVLEHDIVDDLCFQIVLVEGADGLPFEATLSEGWSIESVIATDRASDCFISATCDLPALTGNMVEAVGASGSVEIFGGGGTPNQVTGELELTFDGADWIDERTVTLARLPLELCF